MASKHIRTKELLNQLERLSQRLLEIVARDFSALNKKQFNWKELDDKWSIVECFIHINKVYDANFPELERLISDAQKAQLKPNTSFKGTWFANRFLQKIQLGINSYPSKTSISPVKYAPDSENLEHDGSIIITTFLKNQQFLLELIEKMKFINIQKPKLSVALMGLIKFSLGDLIKILVYHTERHIVQAQRILYHDDFPVDSTIEILEISSN